MSYRKRSARGAALILALLFFYSAGAAFGESGMLKRVYRPGAVSYIENVTEAEQNISGLPMPPMKFEVKQLYGVWERVESVNDGKVKLVLTFDRATRKVAAPMMGEMEFDTDDPEYDEAAPQLGTILKPMIGMSLMMEVTQDGEVLSFSGMDEIHAKISERAVASMHWQQMQDEFSDTRGAETWGRDPLRVYANREVKVGDTWKASSSVTEQPIGTIVTDYAYRVDRIGMEDGRKTMTISVTGIVSSGPDEEDEKEDAGGEPQDSTEEGETHPPKAEVTGTVSGTAVYDVERGRVVRQTGNGKIDIKIPLSLILPEVPPGAETQFATINTSFTSTTAILTEKERNAQKAETRKRIEMRRAAEEEEDEEEEEEDDD
jgi:hypothetical protein